MLTTLEGWYWKTDFGVPTLENRHEPEVNVLDWNSLLRCTFGHLVYDLANPVGKCFAGHQFCVCCCRSTTRPLEHTTNGDAFGQDGVFGDSKSSI